MIQLQTLIFFVLSISVDFVSASNDNDTDDQRLQGRVAGGYSAKFGQIPWTVSVRIRGKHKCSGALINGAKGDHFVLTSANCLFSPKPSSGPYPKEVISVIAGRVNVNSPDGYEQERKVRWLWGNWNHMDRETHTWDLCLIVLDSDFEVTKHVAPIPLPLPGQDDPDDGFVTVSGWGYQKQDYYGEKITEHLQVARVPIFDWETCYNKYYFYYRKSDILTRDSKCAGSKSEGACAGDEGAPAVGISSDGYPYLWGIFQWAHGECPDWYWPGVYANIANYMEWIDEKSLTEPPPL